MKITVYRTQLFEKRYLQKADGAAHTMVRIDARLSETTAEMAQGAEAVCILVKDDASAPVLKKLNGLGVRFLLLGCVGFNNVDLAAAKENQIRVARVPEYSPYAVADHTVALMLALNRRLVQAHTRVRDGNFSLNGLT